MKIYYVYNNWIHKFARIHKAECGFCNDGHGFHKKKSGTRDEWKGRFTKEEAELVAHQTGYEKIWHHSCCTPKIIKPKIYKSKKLIRM